MRGMGWEERRSPGSQYRGTQEGWIHRAGQGGTLNRRIIFYFHNCGSKVIAVPLRAELFFLL